MNAPDLSRRILLVDHDHERASLLRASLAVAGYHDVTVVPDATLLNEQVEELRPAMVLIDVESPSRDTLEQLTTLRDQAPRPVIMFSQDRDLAAIEAAITSGVSAYVTEGIDAAHVQPALAVAQATFSSLQSLRNELTQAKTSLNERKIIERAKGKLMRQQGISEEAAYRSLRKAAMNKKLRLVDVAKALTGVA